MKKNLWRRTSMLLIAVTMPVALAAAPATAAPAPELVGACHMLLAGNVGVDNNRGMYFAMMNHTAPQGNFGMGDIAAPRSGADVWCGLLP